MAIMSDKLRDSALFYLECNTENLAGLLNCCGIQAIVNVLDLLDYLPIIEPNTGGNPARAAHKIAGKVASSLIPKFTLFLGQVKDVFISLKCSRWSLWG